MNEQTNNSVGPQARLARHADRAVSLLLGATTVIGALQAATQTCARLLNYADPLGQSVAGFYLPWNIVPWYVQWGRDYPEAFTRSAQVAVIVMGVGLAVTAVYRLAAARGSSVRNILYGSARWAGARDIQKMGLLPRARGIADRVRGQAVAMHTGVYVGAWLDARGRQQYLRHNGPEHVLCFAPTRSGKGVGLVVPTLLSWPASAVVTDLKGELCALTSGWRRTHARNKVLWFEPAAANGGAQWNPLSEIRLGTDAEVGDVQNLATLLVDPDGRGLADHWQKTAQALLVGVILHALYKARAEGTNATLPGVDAMLSDPDRDVGELWMEMITFAHLNGQNHPVVGPAGRDMIDRPPEEAGSVLSTAKSFLSLYRDPTVARSVSTSTFRIRDLMHHESPVTLYIVTSPTDKTRLRPLVRILLNMIVRLLADKMRFERGRPVANYRHRLLLLLDEFPSLGKLEIFQESLAFLAGYGIKSYLICQDINQLKSRDLGYGQDESITSNCHIQVAFPPNRLETAEYLSKLTGQTTVLKSQVTKSGRRGGLFLSQVSRTTQEVQRALLTPDECQRMPGPVKSADDQISAPGDMVVYVAGYPAIYGRQPLYFQDPIFQARAEVPAPTQSDVLCPPAAATTIRL